MAQFSRRSPLRLRVASSRRTDEVSRRALLPWWGAALTSVATIALVSWVLLSGVVLWAWLTAAVGRMPAALAMATQLWLLAHGGTGNFADISISLLPLGITAVIVWALFSTAQRSAVLWKSGDSVDQTISWRRRVAYVTAAIAGTYTVIVAVVAFTAGPQTQAARAIAATSVVSVLAAGAGAVVGFGLVPAASIPRWLRPVPRAAAAALLTVLACSACAVVVSMMQHQSRMAVLEKSLQMGPLAATSLAVAQLLWSPNLVLWSASYLVGGGFRVGTDTLVATSSTQVGMMPGLPIFAALPDGSRPLYALWLLAGVLAGAVAAIVVMRAQEETSLVQRAVACGLAGLLAAVVLWLLCAISGGDLGSGRLQNLGPRLLELAVVSWPLLTLSAAATGLVSGLIRRDR